MLSHAQATQILRRAGYDPERIEDLLRDLPDPIDIDRDGDVLVKRGIDRDQLNDRMGGSP